MRKLGRLLITFAGVCVIGACSDPTDDGGDDVVPEPGSVAIVVGPGLSVEQGGNGTLPFSITRSGGFTGPVQITVQGAPDGVEAPPITVAPGVTSGSITVGALEDATPGNALLTLRATGQGISAQTANVVLTLTARFDIGIVRFRFCDSDGGTPIFAAATHPAGGWRRAERLFADAFEFPVGPKAGITYVQSQPGGGYRTTTIYGSRTDLQELSLAMCDITSSGNQLVSLPLAGVDREDIVMGGLGMSRGTIVGNTMVFQNVRNLRSDLIAGRTRVDAQTGQYITDRLLLQDVVPGTAAQVIDFSQGVTPISARVTLTNLDEADDRTVLTMVYARYSTYGPYATDRPSASRTRTFYGFPHEMGSVGETHLLVATAASSRQPDRTRTATLATGDVVDQILEFGQDLLTPLVANVGSVAHPRFEAAITMQAVYDDDIVATYRQQSSAQRSAVVRMLGGYVDGPTAILTIPDLSDVSGWNPDWGLRSGDTEWSVTASSYSSGKPPRYILQDARSMSASVSGRM